MKALLLVDIQNDFLPGGALSVPGSDAILSSVVRLMDFGFERIVASRDWHPEHHVSFASEHGCEVGEVVEVEGVQQMLWPDHCIQGSRGAELSDRIDCTRFDKVVDKGVDRTIDSYSAFYDNNHLRSTGLTEYLRGEGIEEIVVVGLATEICVRATVLDALQDGFAVTVVREGCKGLDLQPGDSARAESEMSNAGAEFVTIKQFFDYEKAKS